MEVEDGDYTTQKPQIKGNDKEEWVEDLDVKIILTLKLQMKDKLLDDNYKDEELVLHHEMDDEIQNE